MATLNATKSVAKRVKIQSQSTVNLAGGKAFTIPAKERLTERVLGAFWNENLFYKTGDRVSTDIKNDVAEVATKDPEFILKLAAYARNEMYMRTTPQVLLVLAANIVQSKAFVRAWAPKIIRRADELADVVAFQLSEFGKPIPNSLKRGIADAFAKFDEYQLNKYDSDKGTVKLADVLRLVDRKKDYPVSEAMRNYLINDVVDAKALPKIAALKALLAKETIDDDATSLIKESNVTWETLISKFGSTKENWERVSANMGYMALLRNLRNFEKFDVGNVKEIAGRIADPVQVKRSKQLPFRFYSALKNTSDGNFQKAIAEAFDHSLSSVELEGNNAIIVDLSGSMSSALSAKSDVTYREVAAVLGAVAALKSPNSVVVGFADHAKFIDIKPYDAGVAAIQKILNTSVGGSTFAHKAFELLGTDKKYDRIILVSDMQCYSDSAYGRSLYGYQSSVNKEWETYRAKYPNTYLYSLDVSAYGSSQLPKINGSNVVQLYGWSDKLIDFMKNIENKNELLTAIQNYTAPSSTGKDTRLSI